MPTFPAALVKVLPNGVRIACERRPQAASAAVLLWLAGGTREEGDSEAGYLHLLEHLLLRRTARARPDQLQRRVAALGGAVNAETGREHLALIGRAPAGDAAALAALLVECLCAPRFDDTDLAPELGVIGAERTFVGQTPPDEALMRLAWPQHPLGQPLLPVDPAPVSAAAIQALWARQCVGARLCVAVVGGFDPAAVQAAFSPLESLPSGIAPRWGAPPHFVAGRYGELREDRAATLLWALPCAPYAWGDTNGWKLAAVILEHALTGALRESGLAYACAVWPELYSDAGLIAVHVSAPPGRVAACSEAVHGCLDALAAHGPAPDALNTARQALAARAALARDDLESHARALADGAATIAESGTVASRPIMFPPSSGALRVIL